MTPATSSCQRGGLLHELRLHLLKIPLTVQHPNRLIEGAGLLTEALRQESPHVSEQVQPVRRGVGLWWPPKRLLLTMTMTMKNQSLQSAK